MTGIIALTYKRVEETARTWSHNMSKLVQSSGYPYPLYWWDNTPHGAEREQLVEIAKNYNVGLSRAGISDEILSELQKEFKVYGL